MSTYGLNMLVSAKPAATGALAKWNATTRLWDPLEKGSALQVLRVNAAGTDLEFAAAASSGASTALDNLASVAINTSLISDTNDTDDLGSAAKAWKNAYLSDSLLWNGSSGSMKLGSTKFCSIASDDLRFKATYGLALYATLTDSNPVAQLQAGGLLLGPGGASATDWSLMRSSAGVATLTGGILLAEQSSIELDDALSADGKWQGISVAGTAGAALAFGDVCYLAAADSRWEKVDASAEGTCGKNLIGICVLAAAGDGSATKMLLLGKIRADAKFPTLTIGAPVYASEEAGLVVVSAPTTADSVTRVLGYAITADEMYFNPSQNYHIHN